MTNNLSAGIEHFLATLSVINNKLIPIPLKVFRKKCLIFSYLHSHSYKHRSAIMNLLLEVLITIKYTIPIQHDLQF